LSFATLMAKGMLVVGGCWFVVGDKDDCPRTNREPRTTNYQLPAMYFA
jgi:hypothetical protein